MFIICYVNNAQCDSIICFQYTYFSSYTDENYKDHKMYILKTDIDMVSKTEQFAVENVQLPTRLDHVISVQKMSMDIHQVMGEIL